MEKVIIMSTPLEIAEGLAILLDKYISPRPEADFKAEKMTTAEAALYLGVSYQTLNIWIKNQKVPVHGTGRTRFFLKSELVESYKNMRP